MHVDAAGCGELAVEAVGGHARGAHACEGDGEFSPPSPPSRRGSGGRCCREVDGKFVAEAAGGYARGVDACESDGQFCRRDDGWSRAGAWMPAKVAASFVAMPWWSRIPQRATVSVSRSGRCTSSRRYREMWRGLAN